MNATRTAMLRYLAAKPSTISAMGDYKIGSWAQLSKASIRLHVSGLLASGHLQRSGKVYSATDKGLSFLAGDLDQTLGRICNASSRETYTGQQWVSARPGADDHRKFKSRGV